MQDLDCMPDLENGGFICGLEFEGSENAEPVK